jgi:tetratricopeptide (TPR) repeat protein
MMADKPISKICIELGSVACQRGDYALTYMLYNRSFAKSNDEEDLVLAGTLQRIGKLYAAQLKFKEAAKFLMKALTVCQGMHTGGRRELRDVLDDLAELSHKQGNFSRAIRYYERAMKIEESLVEKDAARRNERLNQIAWLQLRQGQMAEAQTTHSKVSNAQILPVRSH